MDKMKGLGFKCIYLKSLMALGHLGHLGLQENKISINRNTYSSNFSLYSSNFCCPVACLFFQITITRVTIIFTRVICCSRHLLVIVLTRVNYIFTRVNVAHWNNLDISFARVILRLGRVTMVLLE